CEAWLRGVEEKLPSITIAVQDADGRDVLDAHATLDGADASGALRGRALPVDPGVHQVAAVIGGARVATTVVVREGEKDRPVVLRAPAPPTPPPSRALLYGAIAAGGVAVASGGLFAYFSAKGLSDRAAFGCADGCAPARYDTVHGELLAADVSLGVALGSLAVATTLFLLRPRAAKPPAAARATPLSFTF
ncbi:MAG TPA: hypothetical protein VHB21_00150, partial [Minicystis sp.]|nr:hypothetical protein [Minicystis sp.]